MAVETAPKPSPKATIHIPDPVKRSGDAVLQAAGVDVEAAKATPPVMMPAFLRGPTPVIPPTATIPVEPVNTQQVGSSAPRNHVLGMRHEPTGEAGVLEINRPEEAAPGRGYVANGWAELESLDDMYVTTRLYGKGVAGGVLLVLSSRRQISANRPAMSGGLTFVPGVKLSGKKIVPL